MEVRGSGSHFIRREGLHMEGLPWSRDDWGAEHIRTLLQSRRVTSCWGPLLHRGTLFVEWPHITSCFGNVVV